MRKKRGDQADWSTVGSVIVLAVACWAGEALPIRAESPAGVPLPLQLERRAEELAHAEKAPGLLGEFLHGRNGLGVECIYTGEAYTNMRGGINTNTSIEYRGNLDLMLAADLDEIVGFPGGTAFVYAQNGHGRGLTERHVGDFQFLSNIDAYDFTQLSEYRWEKGVLDGKLRVKLGKQDANVDFAVVDLGLEFINSSFGFPPLIPMPTFPDPALGVVTLLEPSESLALQVGVYEGTSFCRFQTFAGQDLVFSVAQVNFRWDLGPCRYCRLPGDCHVGLWYHNGRFPDVARGCPSSFTGNHGLYLGLDQWLYQEPTGAEDEEDRQGLGAFFQYAWSPEDRNEANQYVGGGLRYRGLLRGRDNDVIGLGAAHVRFTPRLPELSSETAFELFYRAQLSPHLALQPDLQYIARPFGQQRDAFVFGLRFELLL